MRLSLVESSVVLSSSDEWVGSHSVARGSCRCSPALVSVWQWGYTEQWRKMAVYLYRKHSSNFWSSYTAHAPLCPSHCGNRALRSTGPSQGRFQTPPPLFLFLLPLSSSFPPSLSLSSCPPPIPIYTTPPAPPSECTWWHSILVRRIPPCKERKSDCNRTQWLFFSGCLLVMWCVVLMSLYVFVEVWSLKFYPLPWSINIFMQQPHKHICTIHSLPHVNYDLHLNK